jgi:CAAX prenyl protease-like protein
MNAAAKSPTSSLRGTGWGAYCLPYLGFMVVITIAASLSPAAGLALLPLRLLVPLGFLVWFWRQGEYAELRSYRPRGGELAVDVALGLASTAIWVLPYLLVEALPRPDAGEGWKPDALGEAWRPWVLGLRFVSFALVTPVMEELFIRSFLLRYLDVFDTRKDFRRVPYPVYSPRSYWGTVIAFTIHHPFWAWPVAGVLGVIWTRWLYHRRQLGSIVLIHAVTNAALFALVVLGGGLRDARGGDLWYFL